MLDEKQFGKRIEMKETEITRKGKNIEEMKRWGLTEKEIDEILKKHLEIIYYDLKNKGEDFEKEFGISREELKEAIKKHPPLAGYNIEDNLKPKIDLLRKIGVKKEKEIEELIKIAPLNKEIYQLIFDTALELKIKIENGRKIKNIYDRLNYHLKKKKGISVAKFIKELKPEEAIKK